MILAASRDESCRSSLRLLPAIWTSFTWRGEYANPTSSSKIQITRSKSSGQGSKTWIACACTSNPPSSHHSPRRSPKNYCTCTNTNTLIIDEHLTIIPTKFHLMSVHLTIGVVMFGRTACIETELLESELSDRNGNGNGDGLGRDVEAKAIPQYCMRDSTLSGFRDLLAFVRKLDLVMNLGGMLIR